MNSPPKETWPLERLTRLENFGHSMQSPAYVYRPTHVEQVAELFALARERGSTVTFRGSGRSYGDAALNSGGLVIDIRRMNRVLNWDPESGVITMEPGVTIEQLWKYTIEDGWWPPVVPGTMFPTLGGCLGTNIHGKNNWKQGTIGEHVLEFSALLPTGETITCSPSENSDLFYAMIGGIGMLGMFTSITMKMKKVHSGNIWVKAWTEPNLTAMLEQLDSSKESNDYVVGWMDCTSNGTGLGRGQMHTADYLAPDEDPAPARTLQVDQQILPDTFFGLVPKNIMHKFMGPTMNNFGVKTVNALKYMANSRIGNHKRYQQTHVAFNFLLDYFPNWERAYGKGGLIQYQCFLPKESAVDVFQDILRQGLKHDLPNYLGVIKRHRPDNFLLSHSVDGFSFAQDYRVTAENRAGLQNLTRLLNEIVLAAGGKFYFAKDSIIPQDVVRRFLGDETVSQFKALKARSDPENVLESDLYRRCFGANG